MYESFAAVLDVAIQDRGVGVQPQLVRDAVHVQPDVRADLALEGLVVDAVVEDFGPAAGERAQPRLFEPLEDPADARGAVGRLVDLGDLGDVDDLHGGEGLDVQVRAEVFGGAADGAHQVGVVLPGEVGMQAADDVHLRGAGLHCQARLAPDVLKCARVGLVVALPGVEVAELAGQGADVGVVEVTVDVVVGDVAGETLAERVGELAHPPQVVRPIQRQAVVDREPPPGVQRVPHGCECGIEGRGGGERGGHGGVGSENRVKPTDSTARRFGNRAANPCARTVSAAGGGESVRGVRAEGRLNVPMGWLRGQVNGTFGYDVSAVWG